MNNLFLNNIGDLNEIQKASFYNFLNNGIKSEILKFQNPFFIALNNNIFGIIYLYPNNITLQNLNYNINFCFKNNLSYTLQIYILSDYTYPVFIFDNLNPSEFNENNFILENNFLYNTKNYINKLVYPIDLVINNTQKKFKDYLENKFLIKKKIKHLKIKQNILLGEIPLMTDEGTFIINGYERIIISQLIRSPGIYFSKKIKTLSSKLNFIATLITNKGNWINIVLDVNKNKKDYIYINFTDFIQNLNLKQLNIENKKNYKLFLYELLNLFNLNIEEIFDSLTYKQHIFTQELLSSEIDKYKKDLKNFKAFIDNNISESLNNNETVFVEDNYENYNEERLYFELNENFLKLEKKTKSCNESGTYFTILANFLKHYFINNFSVGEQGRYQINKKLKLAIPSSVHCLSSLDFIKIIDELFNLKYNNSSCDDIDNLKNKIIRSIGDLLQNYFKIGLYKIQKKLLNFFDNNILPPKYKNNFINPNLLTNLIKDFFIVCELSQFMDQTNPLAELTHKRKISIFGPNGLKRNNLSLKLRDIHPSQYGRLCAIETPEGKNVGLVHTLTILARINSLGSIETPYFFINKNFIFYNKFPIFLNTEQEFNFKISYTNLDQNKNIKNYISVKENSEFSLKQLKDINFLLISPLQIISLAIALIPFLEHNDTNRILMGSNMQRQAVPLLYTQKPIVGTGMEAILPLDSQLIIKTYCEGVVNFSSLYKIEIKDFYNQIIIYYLKKYSKSNQNTSLNQCPIVWIGEKVYSNQIIADGPSTNSGELSLGKNLLIAYMPWEGYNFEDAIVINESLISNNILTSIYIEKYEIVFNTFFDKIKKLKIKNFSNKNLSNNGIIKIGSYITKNDLLLNKYTIYEPSNFSLKIMSKILKNFIYLYENPILTPLKGRIIDITIKKTKYTEYIYIYIAQLRKIQIGDKLSGRHGNKGIISKILSTSDMPHLADGTPIDIILNPLGVPSRMNIGQIFESLLGLAGSYLGCRFKVSIFDEIYGKNASRILINQKLKEAAIITNKNWLFNTSYPTKILLKDGRTGEFFDNPITVGKSYILKLIHFIEDKLAARSVGPYTRITEQPISGKSQNGAQKFGEMEVWALESYGCSYTLQELLTIKSDDITSKFESYTNILNQKEFPKSFISESFLVLIRELNSLGLDFSLNSINNGIYSSLSTKINSKDIFKELEFILKLNKFLIYKKSIKTLYSSLL
jgi:DNA-directed RNA polymerase subunit beta